MKELTIPFLISLAVGDAVNPCALTVLTFMLIAFLTHSPKKKFKALLTGFSFTLAVFILYLLYALVMIGIFHETTEQFAGIEGWIYGFFGLAAILLGCLNLKDFIWYRPGGFLTEMPTRWRPRAKKLMESVVSPKGAFLTGIFITLFLLPCTMGPLVTACVILSRYGILFSLPYLLLYNFIFVLPMIGITFGIFGGLAAVENVSGWKERNIKYLHLIAGIIMIVIALYLVWEAKNIFTIPFLFFEINFLTLGLIEIPLIFFIYVLRRKFR